MLLRALLTGAHPHVCGEHLRLIRKRRFWTGSSPRMRGTQERQRQPTYPIGLIPTYAGNTGLVGTSEQPRGAHPHVCGEHGVRWQHRPPRQGSSPRMRGTPRFLPRCARSRGLIPTYAGNTQNYPWWPSYRWAHPHVCGEHCGSPVLVDLLGGSSPRMRGTQRLAKIRHIAAGLIPTYAGNTLADMGFYPHTPSFRISLEPKASINPTRFLGLSPSGSTPIPASFAPPFPWP